MKRNFWPILIRFFCIFFFHIVKVNNFLYSIIILLHLISSFSLSRSLLIPYAYVFIESMDWIILFSLFFELKAILLISSVKALCLSLLNLCCVFSIGYCFLWIRYNFLRPSMLILFFSRQYIFCSRYVTSKQFL